MLLYLLGLLLVRTNDSVSVGYRHNGRPISTWHVTRHHLSDIYWGCYLWHPGSTCFNAVRLEPSWWRLFGDHPCCLLLFIALFPHPIHLLVSPLKGSRKFPCLRARGGVRPHSHMWSVQSGQGDPSRVHADMGRTRILYTPRGSRTFLL